MMQQIFQLLRSPSFSSKVFHVKPLYVPYFGQEINFKMMHTRSTIFALSSASGISAIAVVRVSGPNTSLVFKKMMKRAELPEARKATLCKIRDPLTHKLLDTALAIWFPSPRSFTGEDMCELHIHGGIAVVKTVLNALQKLQNFQHAEAGEFTKRAFLAGKLDLTEVEGLADLLNAETEAQQRQALRQMDGALCKTYTSWSSKIKRCLANIEAYIDFSEDQDLGSTVLESVKNDIHMLKSEIASQLLDKRKGEKLRNGVYTVLLGRPNVGKSSLLNYLCQRDIAIVSPVAGTTRDIVEASLNLDGYLVNVSDTAGIRETQDCVEVEGVRRAKERSSQADILLLITEAEDLLSFSEDIFREKTDLTKCCQHRGEEPVITRERHRHCVEKCLESMTEFEDCLNLDLAIAAEKLRNAVNELGKITGKVQIDDILDIVFKDFCIGK
ncbi:tRNA modification GTPase GTPBP3, mitochondrial-like isoform X2 [Uloborus diversus]|uniref:tRNA modification GTPase GTPBP3, mitochondrial-like isoform X2 n=1 Tax=Uloborus diversus TaxID=327109 RepID=UPI002409F6B4|nr:tRNA modification GTPase GTPBP3, mitochondrial-like isoform X2 [Uloborus diversus]